MTQALYLAMALLVGAGSGLQLAMLGAVGRQRGPLEATWVTILGTVVGAALLLALRSARGEALLPAPFDRAALYAVVAVLAGVALVLSVREMEPYFALMGLFGLGVVFAGAYLGPRLGVALFISALIAGQMLAALALDHVGAFGAAVQSATALRMAGVAALILGVALVRGWD